MTVEVLFYIFSAIAIIGALLVITSGNPVRAVLCKVLAFVAGAGVWMTMQAEYLSLLLIVVYVGAVLVMFLFVVMMLDIDVEAKRAAFVRYWWAVVPAICLFAGLLIWAILGSGVFEGKQFAALAVASASQNDIKTLGLSMFTDYLYPFELSAMVLLAAMISAITLAFRGKRQGNKAISASKQISVKAKDRIRIVKMDAVQKPTKSEKKDD